MYSVYHIKYKSFSDFNEKFHNNLNLEIIKNKEITQDVIQFSKLLTLETTPNKFLSNTYLDRFFIINGDTVKLFDNNFLLVNSKNFNPDSNTIYQNSNLSNFEPLNKQSNNDSFQNLFSNIKYFSLINNQINKNKIIIPSTYQQANPNINLKNINSILNKNKSTNDDVKNLSNIEQIKNISNNKFYEKGTFIANPNLIMLNNKENVNLCDFRVHISL